MLKKIGYKKSVINIIVLVIAGIIVLSPLMNPRNFIVIGLVSYISPFLIVFNFFLLSYFILKKNILLSALTTILLILNIYLSKNILQFPTQEADYNADFTVLSYNLGFQNNMLYWNPKKDAQLISADWNMKNWIKEFDADIICLQEYLNYDSSLVINNNLYISDSDKKYYYTSFIRNQHNVEFGIGFFSRYPIINEGEITFNKSTHNRAAFIDVVILNDTIRVINTHLKSMGIQSFSNPIALYHSLKEGFSERLNEIEKINEHIEKCNFHLVLCGDTNELPFTYGYRKLTSQLEDSYIGFGWGFSGTFINSPILLPLRLDYIFHSPLLAPAFNSALTNINYSKNYPVFAGFRMIDNKYSE